LLPLREIATRPARRTAAAGIFADFGGSAGDGATRNKKHVDQNETPRRE
jgi:hypothetical protein